MRIWWSLYALLIVCDAKGGRSGGRASSRARFTSSGRDLGSPSSGRGYGAGFSLLGPATRASRSYRNFRNSLRSSVHSNSLRTTGLIVIANPTIPYYYGGNYYYWSHAYYNNRESKRSDRKKCLINFNGTHELDGIYLDENETAPEVVIWECKLDSHCCGVECCLEINDRRRQTFIIIFGIFCALIIIMIAMCCIGMIKDAKAVKYDSVRFA